MKKELEISSGIVEEEKKIPKKHGARKKTPVRTLEEVVNGASMREHALYQKTLATWEKISYTVPPSLLKILKERTKKPEQRESVIQFSEQIKELDSELNLATCIGKLESGGELKTEERETLASAIEQRGWQKILHKLHTGDTLVSVLVPNDPHVSVKYFNDVVFGPKKTDLIIAYRKEALKQVMEKSGLTVLGQGYKDAYIQIPRGSSFDVLSLNGLVEEVNNLVNERIQKMLVEAQKETLRKGDEKKIEAIRHLKKLLTEPETRYQMTFGVSHVDAQEHQNDYSHTERAISQSMKGAIIAREEREKGVCGLDITKEQTHIEKYLERIRQTRETFIQRDEMGSIHDTRDIRDDQGHSFPIMELRNDGTLQMNLELIRDVRKGKFTCAKEDESSLEDIKSYIKLINILDVIKPFVHDELKGETVYGTKETVHSQIRHQTLAIEQLRNNTKLSLNERKSIASVLKSEAKDQKCTSAPEFHEKSLSIDNCTYVSLDVLDVGPRLLQEFDVLLQRVERGEMTFEAASGIAGDETTRQMRSFRSTITDVYQKMTGSKERPLMLVGGDEAVLALESSRVTDAFLIALREETGSRVVKSVVGVGERSSAGQSDILKKQEHLIAQQRAEQGADHAKKIERALYALRLDIQIFPHHLAETYNDRIKDLHLLQYAIAQTSDTSTIIRKDASSIPYDSILEEMTNIQRDIEIQFQKEIDRLQQRGYSRVNNENIKDIIAVQTKCVTMQGEDTGEAIFEKFLAHYRA